MWSRRNCCTSSDSSSSNFFRSNTDFKRLDIDSISLLSWELFDPSKTSSVIGESDWSCLGSLSGVGEECRLGFALLASPKSSFLSFLAASLPFLLLLRFSPFSFSFILFESSSTDFFLEPEEGILFGLEDSSSLRHWELYTFSSILFSLMLAEVTARSFPPQWTEQFESRKQVTKTALGLTTTNKM